MTPDDISLSSLKTNSDGECLGDASTLMDLNIKHGSMIYITSKLSQIAIEKSYVGEDGNMIEAGTKIVVESPQPSSNDVKEVTDPHTVVPTTSVTHNADANTKSISKTPNSPEGQTLTDDEAIAKLLKEDINGMSSSQNLHNHTDNFTDPNIRPPDQPQNLRLFDPQPDYNSGISYNIDSSVNFNPHDIMNDMIGQFIEPGARASAINRHGREPFKSMGGTLPTRDKPSASDTNMEFDGPIMNQDVVENARAAGLSEDEIREIFDHEYAESLQAKVLSHDMEKRTNTSIRGHQHNRFQDLMMDDSDSTIEKIAAEDDKLYELTKNMTGVSNATLERCQAHDFEDEDKILQNVLALSMIDDCTKLSPSPIQTSSESVENYAQSDSAIDNSTVGIVGKRVSSSNVHKPAGARSKISETAGLKTNISISSDCSQQRNKSRIDAGVPCKRGHDDLRLTGKRIVAEQQQSHYASKSASRHTTASANLHEREIRYPAHAGNTSTDQLSDVNVERCGESNRAKDRSVKSPVRENNELHDSMDDEVLAWALRMSALESEYGCDKGANTKESRAFSESNANTTQQLSNVGGSSQVASRTAVSEKAQKLLERLNAEVKADVDKVSSFQDQSSRYNSGANTGLSRLRSDFTEVGANDVHSKTKNPPALNPNYVNPEVKKNSFSGSSNSSASAGGGDKSATRSSRQSGTNSSFTNPRGNLNEGSASHRVSVDVSSMDEDEQLAWALQQSMM